HGICDGGCHDCESASARPGGKRGTSGQAIGHSRGGMTTKILALTDALGNLVKFVLMPGQRHDTKGVRELIADVRFDALLADKAFDVNWLIQELGKRGAQVVISQMPRRRAPLEIDLEVYKWRHLIENFFCSSRSSNVSQCAATRRIAASQR
ncbi:UNVERIFIED_CONTAM: transposase, partial [Bacillus thuringiensis]